MSNELFSIEAGQRFISSEVQDFMNTLVLGLPNWKWLSLTVAAIILLLSRKVIVWLIIKLKQSPGYFLKKSFMQHFIDLEVEKGISWVIVGISGLIVIEALELTAAYNKYLTLGIKLFISVNVIRMCYLAADAFGISMQEWAEGTSTELDDHLAPFARKTLKIAVVIVGALIVLQNFGVNVTALLAGLGIGGVAIAFAAQDTVANMFGTITILLDGPFKLGDVVKIGDTEGTITEIGFRSTRIKTHYNSIVSLPNSVVAKEKIDNLTKRENWIRFNQTLGYTYDTTQHQIDSFCEKLKYRLTLDPDIDKERIAIHLNAFADFSINIIVNFHFKLKEGETIFARNGEYLKLINTVTEETHLSFAYPTQTLILQNKENLIEKS